MRNTLPLTVILLFGASVATAQSSAPTPQARDLAQKLVTAAGGTGSVNEADVARTIEPLAVQVSKLNPGREAEVRRIMSDEFSRAQTAIVVSTNRQIVDHYARSMTPDDMRAVLAFFDSPSGRKFRQATSAARSLQPALAQERSRALQQAIASIRSRFQAAKLKLPAAPNQSPGR